MHDEDYLSYDPGENMRKYVNTVSKLSFKLGLKLIGIYNEKMF